LRCCGSWVFLSLSSRSLRYAAAIFSFFDLVTGPFFLSPVPCTPEHLKRSWCPLFFSFLLFKIRKDRSRQDQGEKTGMKQKRNKKVRRERPSTLVFSSIRFYTRVIGVYRYVQRQTKCSTRLIRYYIYKAVFCRWCC
jgi:hypothetical protein